MNSNLWLWIIGAAVVIYFAYKMGTRRSGSGGGSGGNSGGNSGNNKGGGGCC